MSDPTNPNTADPLAQTNVAGLPMDPAKLPDTGTEDEEQSVEDTSTEDLSVQGGD